MGAWGSDTFENDDALDFVADLADTNDISKIEQALDAVLESEDYLEAAIADVGIAAADVVARLRGHFGKKQETVDVWVKAAKVIPSAETLTKAKAVLDRVRTAPSESLELWSEDNPAEWFAALDSLLQRLNG